MPNKKKKRYLHFTYKKWHIRLLLDKILIFRFFRNLHSRFWGVAGISLMSIGFSLCFFIRPDLIDASTAFSDFGNDVRTAPLFVASVFMGAYGMWRWRNFLSRAWKRTMPVTGLITLTVFGLYLVAFMPISWKPWPSRIHMFGVVLVGFSMLATVLLDSLLSKPSLRKNPAIRRVVSITAFVTIITGSWLTYGSAEVVGWYDVALLGELLMLLGYLLWVGLKTYQGEGNRTQLSKSLKRIVLID